MRVFKSTMFLIILICLNSCDSPYTYDDNGKTNNLTENEPFKIELDGETDSEFAWQLDSKLSFVTLTEPVTKTESGKTKTYTFSFRTESDGEDIIRLIYTDGIDIKKSFQLKIIVGEIGLIEAH